MYYIVEVFLDILFFKPKTAYELRISEWSSDVCSSDLACLSLDMPVRYGQLSEHLKRASLLNMERDVAAQPSSGPTGNSAVMRRVRKLIEQVAGFDTTVLVTGESGTGKEVVARAIHERSPRRAPPFVAVN